MKALSLHHVGIVIPDEHTAELFARLFGLVEDYRGYVPEYEALCIFMKGNDMSPIEFVVPDGGNLMAFNKGKGGIHHLAFEVADIRAAREEMSKEGIQFLEGIPIKGAGDFIVNFIRPSSAYRILVEFVEKRNDACSDVLCLINSIASEKPLPPASDEF